jgi:hypothetical protein
MVMVEETLRNKRWIKTVGKYLMKHCYFVIDADGSDGNTKG